MEPGKLNTLRRIGKVFYFVGYVITGFAVLFGLFRIVTTLGAWGVMLSNLAIVLPFLFYGALIMAGGLLFQWLPQVSETLTKILNNLERLNEKVERLEQPTGVDASVRESDGEDT